MKDILLTTGETVTGFEILEYKYPVFSHVVSGAGFLSEFSASFSDIFGARSESYERRLQLLNQRALEILKSRAREAGANCILGLKIDSDQISGKSTQLFMITAYGTAVVIKNTKSQAILNTDKEIDITSVTERTKLLRLISKLDVQNLQISYDDLELIVNSRMPVFKSLILNRLKNVLAGRYISDTPDDQRALGLYSKYFAIINDDETVRILYDALIIETDLKVLNGIVSVITSNDLVNYQEVKNLITSGSIEVKKQALKILVADRPYYSLKDISDINDMIEIIEKSFPQLAIVSSKKGFLSSNEKEIWVCTCGKNNDSEQKYCSQCNSDIFGFKADDLKPQIVMDFLKRKAIAISELMTQ